MTKSVKLACALLLGMSALLPASAFAQATPVAAQSSLPDTKLRALYDGYAAWDAKESEQFLDARDETKPTAHLPHVDAESQLRRAQHLKELLEQLNAISVQQLSPSERVNAAVFRTVLENGIGEARFRLWEMPFNSDSSFWTYLDSRRQFTDAAEYQRYIARMREIPRYFDEQIVNMRAGLARGFSVPKATLTGRDASISNFLVEDPTKSSFFKAFETMPSSIPQAQQQALKAEAADVIHQSVMPAYRKLLSFYQTEYYPKARTTISAHDLPDGDAYYRANIREYTTTDRSPEEIHQLGLQQVALIEAQM